MNVLALSSLALALLIYLVSPKSIIVGVIAAFYVGARGIVFIWRLASGLPPKLC